VPRANFLLLVSVVLIAFTALMLYLMFG
jgi:hypothetical protein